MRISDWSSDVCSSDLSPDIRKLAEGLLNKPVTIDIAPRNSAVATVDQRVLFVDKSRKSDLLIHLAKGYDWKQTLVFTRTKHGANRLVEKHEKAGIGAAALHGNRSAEHTAALQSLIRNQYA